VELGGIGWVTVTGLDFIFMATWILLYGCATLLSVVVYMLLFTKLCYSVDIGVHCIVVINGHDYLAWAVYL
jgi:hypothetical protein